MKPNSNSLQQHKRSDTVKWVIVFVLVALLIGAVVTMAVTLDRQITTATLGVTAYAIGTLDENGEYAKGTSTIYTKNYVTVDGLTIQLAEDADIQYKVYWYGENDKDEIELIETTEYLTADYNGTIPADAKYAKIVIEPLNDEEISWLEISGIAKQLVVTYNR